MTRCALATLILVSHVLLPASVFAYSLRPPVISTANGQARLEVEITDIADDILVTARAAESLWTANVPTSKVRIDVERGKRSAKIVLTTPDVGNDIFSPVIEIGMGPEVIFKSYSVVMSGTSVGPHRAEVPKNVAVAAPASVGDYAESRTAKVGVLTSAKRPGDTNRATSPKADSSTVALDQYESIVKDLRVALTAQFAELEASTKTRDAALTKIGTLVTELDDARRVTRLTSAKADELEQANFHLKVVVALVGVLTTISLWIALRQRRLVQ